MIKNFKIAKNLLIVYGAILLISAIDMSNEFMASLFNYEIAWLIYSNVNVILGISFLYFLLSVKEVLKKDGFVSLKKEIKEQKLSVVENNQVKQNYTSNKKYFTSVIGSATVTIFFFMPWFEFDCVVKKSISGADMGDILWILPLGALVFISCFFIMHRDVLKWKTLSLVSFLTSFIAIIAIPYKFMSMISNAGNAGGELGGLFLKEMLKHVHIQFGLIMVIVGEVLLLVGSAFYYNGYKYYVDSLKENKDVININPPKNKYRCLGCNNEITLRNDVIAQGKFFCPFCGKQNDI